MSQGLVEDTQELPVLGHAPGATRIVRTRPRILINKHTNVRAVDGVETTTGAAYTGRFRRPKFFEEPEDAPRQNRNQSHIEHRHTIADGDARDVWMTSTQAAHAYVPTETPAGFASNPGIAAMYSTYYHSGRFSRDGIARRPVGLD